MIKLIVGLGNPGRDYTDTRHNAGFWFVDKVADKFNAKFNIESKYFAEVAKFRYNDEDVFLLKPQTFMNLSGKAVGALANFYKIPAASILVVHDELDFAPGTIKLKQGGGNGGHNGLKDIDRVIAKDYWRLRVGIGHPGDKNRVADYVLKKPILNESIDIDNALDKALNSINELLAGDFASAQKQIHTR